MPDRRSTALRVALDELGVTGKRIAKSAAQDPPTVYEAVTRQMVEDMAREISELKRAILGLIGALVMAVLVSIVFRLGGW